VSVSSFDISGSVAVNVLEKQKSFLIFGVSFRKLQKGSLEAFIVNSSVTTKSRQIDRKQLLQEVIKMLEYYVRKNCI